MIVLLMQQIVGQIILVHSVSVGIGRAWMRRLIPVLRTFLRIFGTATTTSIVYSTIILLTKSMS